MESPANGGDNIQIAVGVGAANVAAGKNVTQVIGYTAEQVTALIAEVRTSSQPRVWDGRQPYIGLAPFEEADYEFFFGREKLVKELLARVESARFVAVAGPSGSGKSSLVEAGLIHSLRTGALSGSSKWLYQSLTPRDNPLEQLAQAMARLADNPGAAYYLRQHGAGDPTALHRQAETLLGRSKHQRLLLAIDQFEEIFTQTKDASARETFLALLTSAASQAAGRVSVVIALRSDYISQCAAYPALRELFSTQFQLVGAMDPEELARAIVLPALEVGANVEPELAEQVIADMKGEPGSLPLMQFALKDLFGATARRKGDVVELTRRDYLDRGGVAQALRRYADKVFDQLDDQQKGTAERVFSHLIEIGHNGIAARRRVPLSELGISPGDGEATVIDAFVTDRLLTMDGAMSEAGATVTMAHEALLSAWPWLNRLVNDNRDLITLRSEIADDAAEWVKNNDDSYLYGGARLTAVHQRLKGNEDALNKLSVQFLAKSDEKDRAAKQAVETAHQNELQLAKRNVQLARRTALAAMIVLLLFLIASWAELRRQTTESEQVMTESRRSAAKALQDLSTDPVESIRLSLAAMPSVAAPKPYVPEAEFALTQAVRSSLERKNLTLAAPGLSRDMVATNPLVAQGQPMPAGRWGAIVGGDAPGLVTGDFNKAITLTEETGPKQVVQWGEDGRTWLSRNTQTLYVWHDAALLEQRDFADPLACAEWRPKLAQIATCAGQSVGLWSFLSGDMQKIGDLQNAVKAARWSPNSNYLAAWDGSGKSGDQLIIWKSGLASEPMRVAGVFTDSIKAADWSPDGRYLVATTLDNEVRVYSLDPALAVITATTDASGGGAIDRILFLDDNEHFLTAGAQDLARLWSYDGEQIRKFGVVPDYAEDVQLGPDGTQLLTFLNNGVVQIWDIETGERHGELRGHERRVIAAAWTKNGYLATASIDGTIRVWPIDAPIAPCEATCTAVVTLRGHTYGNQPTRSDILGLLWRDDGQLLSWGTDGTMRTWQVFDDHGWPLCNDVDRDRLPACYNLSAAFHDGAIDEAGIVTARWLVSDTLLATDTNRTAWRITLQTGAVKKLLDESGTATEAIWDPQGQRVFTYVYQDETQPGLVRDFESGTKLAEIGPGPIASAFWLVDGLLVGDGSGAGRLLNPDTWQPKVSFDGAGATLTAAQSYRNERLAIGDENGAVHIWELQTGKTLQSLVITETVEVPIGIKELQWSADGHRLLVAGDSRVRLWNVDSGKPIWSSDDADPNTHAALSPDEKLAAAGIGTRIIVFDAESGRILWQSDAHEEPIQGVQWLLGSRWKGRTTANYIFDWLGKWWPGAARENSERRLLLLTWSGDGTARLRDWESRSEIMRMTDSKPIETVAVNPSGDQILTAGDSGTVRVWQTWINDTDALLAAAKKQVTH